MSKPYSDNLLLLDAVTVSTTGSLYDVSKRDVKSVQFIASGITSGNGVFKIQVSNDGTNWVEYRRLIDSTTTTANLYYGTSTLTTTSSALYLFPQGDYFRNVRAVCTITTDGTYTAILQASG